MRRLASLLAIATLVLATAVLALPAPAAAFSGFGTQTAAEQYGQSMTFSVALPGGAPDRLEILLQFGPDPDSTFVAPVNVSGTSATYTWDASTQYITPNTSITYRWRATSGGTATVSPAGTLLYADNRPGLDWHSARIGQATVHWYGGAESQARRFGDLTSGAVTRATQTLGHPLDGPIDIFVYAQRRATSSAPWVLGPGSGRGRRPSRISGPSSCGWAAAAAITSTPALIHEVTHVVFYDATRNPYHDPAHWLNEGFAVWSQQENADAAAQTVRSEVSSGLFSFDAITGQFPIGSRGSSLSYAEGATMVDMIIRTYGRKAMAGIATAYRAGATDADALQAGTGVSADQLYAAYFRSFGASQPQPVAAATIGPSVVDTGAQGSAASGAPVASVSGASPAPSGGSPAADATANAFLGWVAIIVLVITAALGAFWYRRRMGAVDE